MPLLLLQPARPRAAGPPSGAPLRSLKDLTSDRLQREPSGPSLADLEAQCQSELERQVLRAVQDGGLRLPDETPSTLNAGDEAFAIADSFPAPRIVVFVDSSPHQQDYVQAADDWGRRRLEASEISHRCHPSRADRSWIG